MRAAPLRFIGVAFWPLTIWLSLSRLGDHAADDYVERTSPIVATAIAFWIGAIALTVLATPVVTAVGGAVDDVEVLVAHVRRVPGAVVGVLWFFVPLIYIAGFWLYTARDEVFRR